MVDYKAEAKKYGAKWMESQIQDSMKKDAPAWFDGIDDFADFCQAAKAHGFDFGPAQQDIAYVAAWRHLAMFEISL